MLVIRIGVLFFIVSVVCPLPGGADSREQPQWWALQKPRRPSVPQTENTDRPENPIDAFVVSKHAEHGLTAASPADELKLLRRVCFDLHGLPPTAQQTARFLNDSSPQAYEALIDRLLDSPRYGEKWGRYWLDVVRYADTGGFETDIYLPNAWRYRDYVIKSFNDDKPFDRFVQEQIAADQLWPDDIELRGRLGEIPSEKKKHLQARIGTGMFTIGPVFHEAALNGHQLRYEWRTDAVDTLGEAFMGLTLNCARCHDHKSDPITRRDYHRMMAFFADSAIRNIPVVDKMGEFGFYTTYGRVLRVRELKSAIKRIDSSVFNRAIDSIKAKFPNDVVAAYETRKEKRSPEQRELASQIEDAISEAGLAENPTGEKITLPYQPDELGPREQLLRELGEAVLETSFRLPTATVLGQAEVRYPVHLTDRGDWRKPGEPMTPGFCAVFTGGNEAQLVGADPSRSPAVARKLLAEWLTSGDHPLTARVMVNRIWQGHFGRGIVATPNDFGLHGSPPSHSDLLDWLAVDFVAEGWRVKRLHRLIMTSKTYRMSTAFDRDNAAKDPDNNYLWRMNRRRLEAEALRDAVLATSGALNPKMGGRPVVPPLSSEEKLGMWNPRQWPESLDKREHNRRSVYLYVKRSFLFPMFTTFDLPDRSTSCGRRNVTTVAPQALALLNSQFMLQQATVFGERLRREYGDTPESWIRGAWRLGLSRQPTDQETVRALGLFATDQERDVGAETGVSPLTKLSLIVFNLNEFVYVD